MNRPVKNIVIELPRRLFSATVLLFLLLPFETAKAELPPQAQDTIKQGLSAIEKKDFSLADGFFRDAREKYGAEVYREVGMAEAQIPGRELRAICWLAAYLADDPQGAGVEEVRAKIEELDTKNKVRVMDLVQTLEDAIKKMPNSTGSNRRSKDLADEWISVGDFVSAKKVIDLTGDNPDALTRLVSAEASEAAKQFEAGNAAGSRKTLAQAQKDAPPFEPHKDTYAQYRIAMAQLAIARAQIKAGAMSAAQESIDAAKATVGLEGEDWISETEQSIATVEIMMARAKIKAGDAAGAKAALAEAARLSEFVQKPKAPYKFELLRDIADAQIQAGDLAGARDTLRDALSLPMVYNDAGHAWLEIVRAQVKAADVAGAKKTADLIKGDPSWIFDARRAIAEGQIKTGDKAGAKESFALAKEAAVLYKNSDAKRQALEVLADAQTRAGDAAGARDSLTAALGTIDDNSEYNPDQKSWARQQIAEGLAKAGDKEGALKTAELIQNAEIKSKTVSEITNPPKKEGQDTAPDQPTVLDQFPSENLALSGESAPAPHTTGETWMATIEESFDAPCFTAFTDYSDCKAIAAEIQKEPVRLARHAPPLDEMQSLDLVTHRMVAGQTEVDGLLKLQLNQ